MRTCRSYKDTNVNADDAALMVSIGSLDIYRYNVSCVSGVWPFYINIWAACSGGSEHTGDQSPEVDD